ncbi:MAG: class I SAM-dependent methyltransferase [Methylibium sp.]|uniref:class I SAM-dependent methyltransferase n=1 Tax=Methylibium sp. TaxID=2067992 RepID=UPI0017F90F7F|nr:class I SAM-dependent methyltransferase [Methylibium sp.]MBA3597540.1 class I SAM-dependent methyltransferase [Methylibium sp.]
MHKRPFLCLLALAPALALPAFHLHAQDAEVRKDVPFVPTPEDVVAAMLKHAKVTSKDVIYDLGSGDGRIVISAVKQSGAKGVGVDIDPQRIKEANENAKAAGVTDRVKFIQQSFFDTDISDATVVTLYLLPDINMKLRPKLLKELKPGTRIVSHNYHMGDWKPQAQETIGHHTVYFWVVPEGGKLAAR